MGSGGLVHIDWMGKGRIGGPPAKSSAAAVLKKNGGVCLRQWPGDCVPGHFCGRLLGQTAQCSASRHSKSICAPWLSSHHFLRPGQTPPEPVLYTHPPSPPQIIDPLSGDYAHCHGGINRRHPRSSDTHKKHVGTHIHIDSKLITSISALSEEYCNIYMHTLTPIQGIHK